MTNSNNSSALIVDDELTNRLILKSLLKKQGYTTMEATNGVEAVQMFGEHSPSIIFMDVMMPEMDGYEATRLIKESAGNKFIPIIFLTAMTDQESLSRCIEAGGDDFLVKPYDKFLLQSKIKSMERISKLNREVQGMYSMIRREQEIAETVFINAIQGTNISNPNLRQIIRPAGTFSGDMILSAYNPTLDLLFLVGDFTGHGLAAALGALPVSEIFRAMTTKGFSPENILSAINKKLKSLLPVGIFFGVQLVLLNHDMEYVRIFNAGMPSTLIVDPETGVIKHTIKSAGLPLGIIDTLDTKEMGQYVPINPGDRVLMYSDGLIEARNAEDEEYGDDRLIDTIARAKDGKIFDHILSSLDNFCGNTVQADDVTLVEISCSHDVLPHIEASSSEAVKISKPAGSTGDWSMSLRFNGSRLRETNPVPILVSHLMEMENLQSKKQSLFTVMTELYVNALDHGVLGLDSKLKSDASGFAQYFQERENRLAELDDGYVYFDLAVDFTDNTHSILLRVEDSGSGFDFRSLVDPADQPDTTLSGRGISLVKTLCQTLEFEGKGNAVRALIQW